MASIDYNSTIAPGASARRQPRLRAIDGAVDGTIGGAIGGAIDGAAGGQPPRPHPLHPREYPQEAGAEGTEGAEGTAAGGGMGRLVQLAGALTSLALVGGLIWWGYELVMRDVNGIPVVRALEGPLRVQPEDPGGELARYQGLSVNRIQAEGNAAPAPDRLVLAPRPVDVIESDPPGISPRPRPAPGRGGASGAAPQTPPATPAAAPTPGAPASTASLPGAPAPTTPATTPAAADTAPASPASDEASSPSEIAAAARALVAAIANEEGQGEGAAAEGPAAAEGLSPAAQAGGAAVAAPVAAPENAAPEVIPASVPGVRRSPRPEARPAGLERLAAMAGASAPAQAQPLGEIDPASLPPRTSLAQLGAFDSAEIARQEWARLTARFPDYFAGKARVIEEATTGGRRFFRLRVHGFENMADARRFCSALMAQDAVCIPVMTR